MHHQVRPRHLPTWETRARLSSISLHLPVYMKSEAGENAWLGWAAIPTTEFKARVGHVRLGCSTTRTQESQNWGQILQGSVDLTSVGLRLLVVVPELGVVMS